MAASGDFTSFFGRLREFFFSPEKHVCTHPKYLFLQGALPTSHGHLCCLNNTVTIIHPNQYNNCWVRGEDLDQPSFLQLPLPPRKTPRTHIDLSNIQHQSIEDVKKALEFLLSKSPALSMTLSNDTSINRQLIPLLQTKFPHLRGLQLTEKDLLISEMPQVINRSGIIHIDVSSTHIDDANLMLLIEQNPELESLDISDCDLITDEGFKAISTLTKLKTLIALHVTNVTPEGLKYIPTDSLKYLVLGSLRGFDKIVEVNDEVCKHLSRAVKLKHLDLSGCGLKEGITDEGLAFITGSLVGLEFLSLQNRYMGTTVGLRKLERLRKLISLNLISDDSKRIADDIVISMLGGLPHLKILKLTGNIQSTSGEVFRSFSDSSVETIWLDMNEPEIYQGIKYLPKNLIELKLSAKEDFTIMDESLCGMIASFNQLRVLTIMHYFLSIENLKNQWDGKFVNLEELVFAGGDPKVIESICKNCPELRTLEIDKSDIQILEDDLTPIYKLSKLKRLFGVELSHKFVAEIAGKGISLESLQIGVSEPEALQNLTAFSTTLKDLTLGYQYENVSGAAFLAQLVNLESLSLYTNFSAVDYHQFLPFLKKLQFLCIADQTEESSGGGADPVSPGVDSSVLQLISTLPALKTLWIMNSRIAEEHLAPIRSKTTITNVRIEV